MICSAGVPNGMGTFVGSQVNVSHIRVARVCHTHILWHRYDSSAGPTYHPSIACGAHVPRLSGFLCIRTCVPGGPSGVLLKLKVPCSCAHADNLGLSLDARNRFNVMVAWSSSLSHKCKGKSLSTLHNPAMKWFLNVLIARSAAFRRWMPGGTSW